MSGTRRIYKSLHFATQEVRDLIEAIFVSELIRPSKELWLVSPWISDLPVIDNTSEAFSGIEPGWGPRPIRLTEILSRLWDVGGSLTVVTRPDELNAPFLSSLRTTMSEALDSGRLTVLERARLHEKGILGEDYHVAGSMNLTYFGVEINDEFVIYDTDHDVVARARRNYSARYLEPQRV